MAESQPVLYALVCEVQPLPELRALVMELQPLPELRALLAEIPEGATKAALPLASAGSATVPSNWSDS